MTIAGPFVARPIGTILIAIGLLIAGIVAYAFLPVSPLPSVDVPVIVVLAARPGADPETMANSIAGPLERRLGEIPGVTELTSTSSIGNTAIVILFDIGRDIDSAAHDVQAAINAAATDLPADLPTRPYYRKINPADAPILTIALTSDTLSTAQIYDAADTVLAQRLAQSPGVSQVTVNGAEQPAVRVQLDPVRLAAAGLSGDDIYKAIRGANVTEPVGGFEGPRRAETIGTNGQISQAADYAPLVLKAGGGAILRLSDVARVIDGTANTRLAAWDGNKPAILLSISKLANANVIDTVDRVKALIPQVMRWMPPDIHERVVADRTTTIRASINGIQRTLLITIALVLMVVALFMRRAVPTIAAAVTVPLSICGTLAGMWLFGFALDNFSLMALTISVGFVVDDAIVVIENIVSHRERGLGPIEAALAGSRQIGFTVISISVSLVAVFIPLLFMGGIIGRLLHEFAITLTIAIAISAVVSLTLTPMVCARFMRAGDNAPPRGLWGRIDRVVDGAFRRGQRLYGRTLGWTLRHGGLMLLVTLATLVLTIRLYGVVPKGFLPEQDTGQLIGSTLASPDVSFKAMARRQESVVRVILNDPAVASVGSLVGVSSGWSQQNRGTLYISLKPLAVRRVSAAQVIARLKAPLAELGGVRTFMFSEQDLHTGGRSGGSEYQFAVISPDLAKMRYWNDALEARMRTLPGISGVTSDQDAAGPQVEVQIDRTAASRLGVSAATIDDALSNAFSQRQISTIYTQRNQYRVVLEIDPRLQGDPAMLSRIYVGGLGGAQVPLSAVARFVRGTAPVGVNHQGQFPAGTLSFNLDPGTSLGQATAEIQAAAQQMRMPSDVRTEFGGNAKLLTQSLSSEPLLIVAALVSIYIVLGVLYESLLHPLTILSSLPSAGLGALLALLITGTELSVIAIIGIILLMGIVKKNAIMLVDFALDAERTRGMSPRDAIQAACMERFRPITMTTLAALLGSLPLALASGTGSELRHPLGITICGGLIVSQMLTLYTTPAVYLGLERLRRGRRRTAIAAPLPAE